MTADQLYDQLDKHDPDGAVAVARAFLDERGELPESIWHTLGMLQVDKPAMWKQLLELREQHFKARGLEAPPYAGGWE